MKANDLHGLGGAALVLEGEFRRHWKFVAGLLGTAVVSVLLLNWVVGTKMFSHQVEYDVVRLVGALEGVLLVLTPVFFGILQFGRDQTDGSAALVASLPVSQRLVWATKVAFALVASLGICAAIVGLFNLPCNAFVQQNVDKFMKLPKPGLILVLGAAVLLSVAMFTSLVTRQTLAAALITLAASGLLLFIPMPVFRVLASGPMNYLAAVDGSLTAEDSWTIGFTLTSLLLFFLFLLPSYCLYRRGRGLLLDGRARSLAAALVFGLGTLFTFCVQVLFINACYSPDAALVVPLVIFTVCLLAGWVLLWAGSLGRGRRLQKIGGSLLAAGSVVPLLMVGVSDARVSNRLEQTFEGSRAWVKPLEGSRLERPVFRDAPLDEDAGAHYFAAGKVVNAETSRLQVVVQPAMMKPCYQATPLAERRRNRLPKDPVYNAVLKEQLARVREHLDRGVRCRFISGETWMRNQGAPLPQHFSYYGMRVLTAVKWTDAYAHEEGGRLSNALTEHLEAAALCVDLLRHPTYYSGSAGITQLKNCLERLLAFLWRHRSDARLMERAGECIDRLVEHAPEAGSSLRSNFYSWLIGYADMYDISKGRIPRHMTAGDADLMRPTSYSLALFTFGYRRSLLEEATAIDRIADGILDRMPGGEGSAGWTSFSTFLRTDSGVRGLQEAEDYPSENLAGIMTGMLRLPLQLKLLRAGHACLLHFGKNGTMPETLADLRAFDPTLDLTDDFSPDRAPLLYRVAKTRKGEPVPVLYSRGFDRKDQGWRLQRTVAVDDLSLVPSYEFDR